MLPRLPGPGQTGRRGPPARLRVGRRRWAAHTLPGPLLLWLLPRQGAQSPHRRGPTPQDKGARLHGEVRQWTPALPGAPARGDGDGRVPRAAAAGVLTAPEAPPEGSASHREPSRLLPPPGPSQAGSESSLISRGLFLCLPLPPLAGTGGEGRAPGRGLNRSKVPFPSLKQDKVTVTSLSSLLRGPHAQGKRDRCPMLTSERMPWGRAQTGAAPPLGVALVSCSAASGRPSWGTPPEALGPARPVDRQLPRGTLVRTSMQGSEIQIHQDRRGHSRNRAMGKADRGQEAGERVVPEQQVGAAPLRARASGVLGRSHAPPALGGGQPRDSVLA